MIIQSVIKKKGELSKQAVFPSLKPHWYNDQKGKKNKQKINIKIPFRQAQCIVCAHLSLDWLFTQFNRAVTIFVY